MRRKAVFYTELSYFAGMILLAIGTAFMERADFGMSMVVAPAYLLHLKVSEFLPFFTFGMAEYTLQVCLLLVMVLLLRKFRFSYLFSVVTAVLYGFTLDGAIWMISYLPGEGTAARVFFYIFGMLLGSAGVSFFFHTYISPEVYELFVQKISSKWGVNINKFKTAYDCVSCGVGVALSFAFFGFGHFEGVKLGTVFCALTNGFVISRFTRWLEARFYFQDRLAFRRYFE